MSISHSVSGVFLFISTLSMLWFSFAVALNPSLSLWLDLLGETFLMIFLYCWMLALYYHMCNGVSHIFWDYGKGFSLSLVRWSNVLVLISSVVLSFVTLLVVYDEF